MLWQLGEIFPTGGWGSLEYAHTTASTLSTGGQVRGGRWKPLHYWFEAFLFGDVLVACGDAAACYVRNDAPLRGVRGARVELELVSVVDGSRRALPPHALPPLPAGPAALTWFCAGGGSSSSGGGGGGGGAGDCKPWPAVLTAAGCAADGSDCILNATVIDAGGATLSANPSLLAPPAALLKHLKPPRLAATVESPAPPAGAPIRITVTAQAPALFVTLSTLAQGRFSRNAFFLVGHGVPAGGFETEVLFLPTDGEGDQYGALSASLSVLSV